MNPYAFKTFPLRFAPELNEKVTEAAKEDGKSKEQYILDLIVADLKKKGKVE